MDVIRIEDLEVFAYHGVMESERITGQKFLVTIEMFLSLYEAGGSDDLDKTLNYAKVCEEVKEFMLSHKYYLIETVAQKLSEKLLIEYKDRLQRVRLTVKKPQAPVPASFKSCEVTVDRAWHKVFIGAGSNMGDRQQNLRDGIAAFEKNEAVIMGDISDIIETKPYGYTQQDDFYNLVFEMKTILPVRELLKLCKDTEKAQKREETIHWGPRTLDMDILFYDDEVIDQKDLVVPHCDMKNREFVLRPLMQIAPHFIHPVYRMSISEMYAVLCAGSK